MAGRSGEDGFKTLGLLLQIQKRRGDEIDVVELIAGAAGGELVGAGTRGTKELETAELKW